LMTSLLRLGLIQVGPPLGSHAQAHSDPCSHEPAPSAEVVAPLADLWRPDRLALRAETASDPD
jgi:hypothetical protein